MRSAARSRQRAVCEAPQQSSKSVRNGFEKVVAGFAASSAWHQTGGQRTNLARALFVTGAELSTSGTVDGWFASAIWEKTTERVVGAVQVRGDPGCSRMVQTVAPATLRIS